MSTAPALVRRRRGTTAGFTVLLTHLSATLAPSALLSSCGGDGQTTTPTVELRREVWTSAPFLEDWVRALVPPDVTVIAGLPDGAELAAWSPRRDELLALQSAMLIVLHGADLEPWASRVALPGSRVVMTAEDLDEHWIEHEVVTHSHGGGEPHVHAALDAQVWVDPALARKEIAALVAALIRHFPEVRAGIETAHAQLDREYESLAGELAVLAERSSELSFLSTHRSWSYLLRAASLESLECDLDAHDPPDAEALSTVEELVDPKRTPIFLWETPPSAAVVDTLAPYARAHLWLPSGRSRVFDEADAPVPHPRLLREGFARWSEILDSLAEN